MTIRLSAKPDRSLVALQPQATTALAWRSWQAPRPFGLVGAGFSLAVPLLSPTPTSLTFHYGSNSPLPVSRGFADLPYEIFSQHLPQHHNSFIFLFFICSN